jgi:hypothetical protein
MWFFAPSLESCFLSLYNRLYFHKHAKKNILCVKAKNKILTGKRTTNLHKSITKVMITKWQSWQVAKCLMVRRKTSASSISHGFYHRVFFQESPSVFFWRIKGGNVCVLCWSLSHDYFYTWNLNDVDKSGKLVFLRTLISSCKKRQVQWHQQISNTPRDEQNLVV